jgi:hypothetical protein
MEMPCSEELSLNLTEAAWVSLKIYDCLSLTLVEYSTQIAWTRKNDYLKVWCTLNFCILKWIWEVILAKNKELRCTRNHTFQHLIYCYRYPIYHVHRTSLKSSIYKHLLMQKIVIETCWCYNAPETWVYYGTIPRRCSFLPVRDWSSLQ